MHIFNFNNKIRIEKKTSGYMDEQSFQINEV